MIGSKEIAGVRFEYDSELLYTGGALWEFTPDDAREFRAFIGAFLGDSRENVVPLEHRATPAQIERELLQAALEHARAGEPEQVIALVEAIEAVRRL